MSSFIVLSGCYCNKIHNSLAIYHEMKEHRTKQKYAVFFPILSYHLKIHNSKNYKNAFLRRKLF